MSSAAMPGSFLSPMGSVSASLPSGPRFGPDAEVDEVLPVERGQQERGRHAELREHARSASPLASKCGTLYLPIERRHAVVGERHPLARVLERGPDHVLHAGLLRRLRHGCAASAELLLGREVLPEVGDAERAVGAFERPLRLSDRRGRRRRPRRRASPAPWPFGVGRPGERAGGEAALVSPGWRAPVRRPAHPWRRRPR